MYFFKNLSKKLIIFIFFLFSSSLMNNRRRIIVFLLTFFLLTSCISSQPARSRRQKRGLLKMMMHIVWDPVRLIRYWYAYDVTKEIAKSWRKIIPTILLLPVTQHMPHSHGLAKYIHPTVGVRDSDKKKIKHSNRIPKVPYYQRSTAIQPSLLHQSLPSRYPLPQVPIQYYSSKEVKGSAHKNNNLPHVFVNHVPYEDDKSHNQYSVAHYVVDDSSSREETPVSNVVFPNEDHSVVEEDSQPLSSQKILFNEYNERLHHFPSILPQSYLHYESQEGFDSGIVHSENTQDTPPVLHPEQEFHIVLHPIPINNVSPDSIKPQLNGKTVHFIPIQLHSNDTNEMKFASSYPFLLKAVPQNSSDSGIFGKDQGSFSADLDTDQFDLNFTESSLSEENTNVSFSDTKSRVTWIPQKNASNTRRTDNKETELQSDESKQRPVSVHRNYLENLKLNKDSANSFSINRNNINIERLREALKHGTPVLIPFNKNTHSSDLIANNNSKNTVTFPQKDYQNKNSSVKIHQEIPKDVPGISNTQVISSSEHSGERNSTQRLLLFLKKREHLQTVA